MDTTWSRLARLGAAVAVLATLVSAVHRVAAAPPAPRAIPPSAWLGGVRWLNRAPLTPDSLRGRAVLVEFWTFDCINCRRTVPAMRALDARLRGRGDVLLVGIHTPELAHERERERVAQAVREQGIRYAVALDNDEVAWRAFGNQYWPALYLVDPQGRVRWTHVGELHQGTPAWNELLARLDAIGKRS